MRPCSCNRFAHCIVWIGNNDWKLEFVDRKDWLSFKGIYKECYVNKMQSHFYIWGNTSVWVCSLHCESDPQGKAVSSMENSNC